ncbi:hypothetical protein GGI20_001044 [Coemansia sp. BCRC 34301]|nr:hypothetical protein GGI20_001044 [Coemansia sp. BCRC 34301]
MNFSFASAPNTPYMPQADGRSGLGSGVSNNNMAGSMAGHSVSSSATAAAIHAAAATRTGGGGSGGVGGFVGATRSTDPLNDIGSPVSLQYLQFAMSSPFFISEAVPGNLGAMGSPATGAIGLGPKHLQASAAPAVIVTASASPASAAVVGTTGGGSAVGIPKLVLSPAMDDTLPGFFHPAEVFTTPKIQHLSDASQKTPDLALFDDSEAIIISALSPRTQTAQAGLSLLAASATFARSPVVGGGSSHLFGQPADSYSNQQVDDRQSKGLGSPYLRADGVDATLMSQPQNSLAQHLSPQLMDHHSHRGHHHHHFQAPLPPPPPPQQSQQSQNYYHHHQQQQAYGYRQDSGGQFSMSAGPSQQFSSGRLMQKRSLLRQSSGLTSASFHNDLVPQATESFFAPLDEVCSDSDALAGTSFGAGRAIAQPIHHRQPTAPRMGAQFSPVMNHAAQYPQRGSWVQQRDHVYQPPLPPPPLPQRPATNGHASSIPGVVFSQMPTLAGGKSSVAPPPPPPPPPQASPPLANEIETEEEEEEEEEEDEEHIRRQHSPGGGGSEASDFSQSDSHGPDGSGRHKRRRMSGAPGHKRDQQRRFDCDICRRSFARQYNLKTHRLTHFPEARASRPFQCPHCPKAFTRKHDLQRHAVLHERTDKYTCPRCAMGFQRKDAMKKHLDSPRPCQEI